jgi:hypothetical protein
MPPRHRRAARVAPCRRLPAAIALCAGAVLALPRGAAAQEGVACPRYVDVAPIADVNAPRGWSASSMTTRRWLRGAQMFEGDPAANQPIRGRSDPFRGTTEWTIPPGSQAPTLVCQYRGTDVTLARVVPDGYRRCYVSSERPGPMRQRSGETDPDGANTVVVCR